MRRDRSPSEDRGRAPNPVWDNPGSQLPGTGLGAGFESRFVWYFEKKRPFYT